MADAQQIVSQLRPIDYCRLDEPKRQILADHFEQSGTAEMLLHLVEKSPIFELRRDPSSMDLPLAVEFPHDTIGILDLNPQFTEYGAEMDTDFYRDKFFIPGQLLRKRRIFFQ